MLALKVKDAKNKRHLCITTKMGAFFIFYKHVKNANANSFNKTCFKTRSKNRCVISGRSRSIFRQLRMSRILLRSSVKKNSLPFIHKYCWLLPFYKRAVSSNGRVDRLHRFGWRFESFTAQIIRSCFGENGRHNRFRFYR